MAFTKEQIKEIENAFAKFMYHSIPPVEIRDEIDFEYSIEDQSVYLYEVRPRWHNPVEKNKLPIAKTTYVKSQNKWKIFWMRGNLKWHMYEPLPIVDNILAFFDEVIADTHCCFFG